MSSLIPYLTFDNTKEALAYYEAVFGATDIQRLPVDANQAINFGLAETEAENATMHAEFKIAGTTVLASDAFGGNSKINDSIALLIDYDLNNEADTREVEALYERVSQHESIEVAMPLAEQFWGGKMAVFTDKYNVKWMLHGQH